MKPFQLSRTVAILVLLLCVAPVIYAQVHFRHYSPGRYYDLSGVKHPGFIDFTNNFWGSAKINFKSDSVTAPNQKLDLADIKALVVMHKAEAANSTSDENQTDTIPTKKTDTIIAPEMTIDSFVVVQEAKESFDDDKTVSRLCRFIVDAVNAKIYAREVQKNAGGIGAMHSFGVIGVAASISVSYTDTLYLAEVNGKALQIRRNNYKEILTKAFADYPELVKKIQTKELRYMYLDDMIAMYVRRKSK